MARDQQAVSAYVTEGRRRRASVTREGSNKILWVFMAYLVIEYVRPQYFVPALGVVRPGLIVGLILLGVSLTKGIDVIKRSRIVQLCVAFTLFTVAWVPFAVNNYWAFNTAEGMVLHIFATAIPLIVLADSKKTLTLIVKFWVGVSVYIALFAMTHAGHGPGSFVTDENDAALFLLTGLPFAYFIAQESGLTALKKWLLYAAVGVIVMGIIATQSRGGFVGLVAVICGLIWYSRRRLRSILVIGLLAAVILPFVPQSYVAQIVSINNTHDPTRLSREHLWRVAWVMFKANPILGVGPGNYPWRVPEYEKYVHDSMSYKSHGGRVAHSLYFTLLPELGLLGVALYFPIVYVAVRICRRFTRREDEDEYPRLLARAIIIAIGGYLVSGAFLAVLYYPELWLLAAFAVVVGNLSSSTEPPPKHRRSVSKQKL